MYNIEQIPAVATNRQKVESSQAWRQSGHVLYLWIGLKFTGDTRKNWLL